MWQSSTALAKLLTIHDLAVTSSHSAPQFLHLVLYCIHIHTTVAETCTTLAACLIVAEFSAVCVITDHTCISLLALMPPPAKSMTELGVVAAHSNGWRARLTLDKRKIHGPQRAARSQAQEDLHTARLASSRLGMKKYLLSLRKRTREDFESQESDPGKSPEAADAADRERDSAEISTHTMPDSVRLRQVRYPPKWPGGRVFREVRP